MASIPAKKLGKLFFFFLFPPNVLVFMLSNQVLLHVVLYSGEVSGCSGDFKGLMSMPTPGALNIKKHLGQAKNTGNFKGIIHPKIKLLSPYTHSDVVSNL